MKTTESTTAKGDRLRDDVYALLKAAGKEVVEKEKYLSGKKCDVYYEDSTLMPGAPVRFAIECKSLSSPLDADEFRKIYGDYHSKQSHFDILIVVTELGLTSSVQDSFDANKKWMRHEEYQVFCNRLFDVSRYLIATKELFENDGLNQYYESVLDQEGNEIEEIVTDWVEGDSKRPKAILAGYGMGKTSFSQRLAYRYAEKCRAGETFRVPVYIKLGEISKEQSLSGLICKHFAEEHDLRGFSYGLFRSFNRKGRFLIILDGFDEMKHAMTFDAFEHNLRQFGELVEGNARVLLLGRGNAFMSDDEKYSVLHGMKKVGKERIASADMPSYDDIEVAKFNSEQLARFVSRYVSYTADKLSQQHGMEFSDDTLSERIRQILDPSYQELISRPVHARMLVQVALGTTQPLDNLLRYDLYQRFFADIEQREQDKPSRQETASRLRRQFAKAVAWKAWIGGESGSITQKTLRKALREVGVDHKDPAQLREFVVGSVLESKPPDQYYFAHRSFIEFHAAQYLIDATPDPLLLNAISDYANEEILNFISESGEASEFSQSLLDVLSSYKRRIRFSLLQFFAVEAPVDASTGLVGSASASGAGPVLVHVLALGDFSLDKISEDMLGAFTAMSSIDEQLALLIGVCRRARTCTDDQVLVEVATALVGTLQLGAFETMQRHTQGNRGTAADTKSLTWTELLVASVSPQVRDREVRSLSLDIGLLEEAALKALDQYLTVEEFETGELKPVDVLRSHWMKTMWLTSGTDLSQEAKKRRDQERRMVDDFWRSRPRREDFVPISTRSPRNTSNPKTQKLGLNSSS